MRNFDEFIKTASALGRTIRVFNPKTRRDRKKVVRSLLDSDYKDFDKPHHLYDQRIKYDGRKPVGFISAEKHKKDGKKVIDLSVAVIPEYRGRGIAYDMAKDMIDGAGRDRKISGIYWGAEKGNKKSVNLAKKLGFNHDYDHINHTIYKKSLER